jgi:hypothetical protein
MLRKRTKLLTSLCLVLVIFLVGTEIPAQDVNLQAVGALSSANLYLTYIAIGSVADGHSREVYSNEFADSLLSSIIDIAGNSMRSLAQVLETEDLDETDTIYVKEAIDTLKVLIDQAESYKTYIDKKSPQYAEIYNNYKQIAWQQVTELLNLDRQNPAADNDK